MDENSKILITGHNGLASTAIGNVLRSKGFISVKDSTIRGAELMDALFVKKLFDMEMPEFVVLVAASERDIITGNFLSADFLYKNLQIQNNVIWESYSHQVKKLLFVADSCVYPNDTGEPVKENILLTSTLDYSSEPYAIAMIAGLKMCESFNLQYGTNFIAVTPASIYGPNDNFNLDYSRHLSVLIRKMYLAKCLQENNWSGIMKDLTKRTIDNIQGKSTVDDSVSTLNKYGIYSNHLELDASGNSLREFLWSEDMADACHFLLMNINFTDILQDQDETRNCHINVGTGKYISYKDLALLVAKVIGYNGRIKFNSKLSDISAHSLLDVNRITSMGWSHKTEIEEGVNLLYSWYIKDLEEIIKI